MTCAEEESFAMAATIKYRLSIVTASIVVHKYKHPNNFQDKPLMKKSGTTKRLCVTNVWTVAITVKAMMYAHSLYNPSEVSIFMTVRSSIIFGICFMPSIEHDIKTMKKKPHWCCAGNFPTSKYAMPTTAALAIDTTRSAMIRCLSRRFRMSCRLKTTRSCFAKRTPYRVLRTGGMLPNCSMVRRLCSRSSKGEENPLLSHALWTRSSLPGLQYCL
mmetsp:Transcript_43855/g.121882  ORF Transcript_43855/g.121882 Transcript_43855/m.121882 type:complete len:216 (+) Transcript_43855:711-1358(+)